jgi:hypothetical protein
VSIVAFRRITDSFYTKHVKRKRVTTIDAFSKRRTKISSVLVKTKTTKKYIKVFTASIADINKALRKKSKTNPRKVLDPFYHL